MCDESSCCKAINTALSEYFLGIIDPINNFPQKIRSNFENEIERTARAQLTNDAIDKVSDLVRGSLRFLNEEKSSSKCCSNAALTIRDAGIAYVNFVILISTNNLFTTPNVEETLESTLDNLKKTIDLALNTTYERKTTPKCHYCRR
jgi:hypothetical protein